MFTKRRLQWNFFAFSSGGKAGLTEQLALRRPVEPYQSSGGDVKNGRKIKSKKIPNYENYSIIRKKVLEN